MNNWQTKKLGDIVDITSGTWGPADNQGTAVLRSTNFTNNGYISFDDVAYREVETNKINRLALEPGDILLEKSGGSPVQPVGRVVFFDKQLNKKIVFGNFISRLKPQGVNNKYLFYYLLYLYKIGVTNTLQSQTTGIRNLVLNKYLDINIELPASIVQQQIVDKLDATRKLQEINIEEIKKTEELFISFLRNRFAKQTDWKTENIRNVANIFGGGTPSKSNPKYWNGSIPWVSPKDMKFLEISNTEDHITEEAVKNSSTSIVPEKASLIVFRSGVLQHSVPIAITRRNVALNQDMKALVCNENLDSDYLFYWLLGHKPEIRPCIKTGGTVQSIDSKRFYALALSYPDLKIQKQIVSEVESIFLILKEKQNIRDLLKELFESTLHRLLSNKQYEQ